MIERLKILYYGLKNLIAHFAPQPKGQALPDVIHEIQERLIRLAEN
jgi:hypothetical protein